MTTSDWMKGPVPTDNTLPGNPMQKDYILTRERARLQEILEKGLPSVYGDTTKASAWDEYTTDWLMDFSWSSAAITELKWCYDDLHIAATCANIEVMYGHNPRLFYDVQYNDMVRHYKDNPELAIPGTMPE